ncbi:hypothetical protein ASG90_10895 [Nocardioides sp. Soil797]|nr:hypothetical protein ASG90_10895 [Nocardioides sp. Soil797]
MTVVVIGHALVLVLAEGRNEQVYDFIYTWHIPAFVLVTGYLSRRFTWSRPKLWSLFCTIVVPYLIFEWAMLTFRHHYGDYDTGDGPMWLDPHWPLWYLSATFLWRMATPILIKHWVALPLSVVASLLMGTQHAEWTTWLDLQRTVGFLPFFVLGLHLRPQELARLKSRFAPLVGAAVLVGLYLLAGQAKEWMHTSGAWHSRWLWFSIPYDDLGASATDGMWIRFRVLMLGALGVMAVLAVVPRRHTWFSNMGGATLIVYLFHGFFVRRVEYAGYPDWAADHASYALWVTIALAIAVALFLASPPVVKVLTWAVDPIGSTQRRLRARSR